MLYIANNPTTSIRCGDGVQFPTKAGLTDMSTAVRKRISSWGAAGLKLTGDGAAETAVAFDGTMGSGANLEIGHSGGINQWSGTMRNVQIYLTQFSSAAMQAKTA
jgi:hypothetical protein